MKISLRKVNALQLAINQVIGKISLGAEVAITEYETPSVVISTNRSDLNTNMDRRNTLIDVLYDIRTKVGDANHTSGVDRILAKIAQTEKKLQTVELLANRPQQVDMAIILGKIDKIKNRSTSEYFGQADTVNTSSLSQEDLVFFKATVASLKKQKQLLQDQLLELNVRTEIELDDTTVKVLETEQLL